MVRVTQGTPQTQNRQGDENRGKNVAEGKSGMRFTPWEIHGWQNRRGPDPGSEL